MAKKKADPAHAETDKLLEQLEKRIAKEYKQAINDINAKLQDHLAAFEEKDKTWREMLAEGKVTKQEYKNWRVGQIAVGKRWNALKDELAKDLHNTNRIARKLIDEVTPEVYSLNFNWSTYDIETKSLADTSFALINSNTVASIMKDNPEMLPPPGKDITRNIYNNLDVRWNRQQLQSIATQAALQGLPIPEVAAMIATKMGEKNKAASIRNARTMVTGAQNKARLDAGERAKAMGIDVEYQWNATLDNRTRHTHRQMDGERKTEKDEEFSNGCRYPADPNGPAAEVYNCRCRMSEEILGIDREKVRTSPKLGGMDYEKWKNSKVVLTKEQEKRWMKDGMPDIEKWMAKRRRKKKKDGK